MGTNPIHSCPVFPQSTWQDHHLLKRLCSFSPGLQLAHTALVQISLWGEAVPQVHSLASGIQAHLCNGQTTQPYQAALSSSAPTSFKGQERDMNKGVGHWMAGNNLPVDSYLFICHNKEVEARHSQGAANGIWTVPTKGEKREFY